MEISFQNCEIPSCFLENTNIAEWESKSFLSVWSINAFTRDLFQCLVIMLICRTDVSKKCHSMLWKSSKILNITFMMTWNRHILLQFCDFYETLELPTLFYMKLKVKVYPTEKLYFKLAFPDWYSGSFMISFSVIVQLSS